MRILIIHTFYSQKGGEDAVFEQEYQLLKEKYTVEKMKFFNSTGIKGLFQFAGSIWNISATQKLIRKLNEFKPDLVHIHNWHFASGPLIIRAIHKKKIPIILTLHNFRLLCPSGILFHNGSIYTESLKVDFPFRAVFSGVYRNSILQTFWLAFIIWFHKVIGTWNMVSRYLLLTDFARNIFIESSFSVFEEKLVVKPNFLLKNECVGIFERSTDFLFVGRLTEEKGIKVILDAFIGSKYVIKIVGEGPLKEMVQVAAKSSHNIIYIGPLDKNGVLLEMAKCSAIVFPSVWYEGMPMTIIEALAMGTPVIASNIGAMMSMIESGNNGFLFEVGDVKSLLDMLDLWNEMNLEDKHEVYLKSKQYFNDYYSEKSNLIQFEKIIQNVFSN
ncbi:glycosyltransferase [Anditalea andensis]|uniref:Glycosyl transferase family 1 n=1 Tax=Anditalea andensis TaxID=1048983 RepID=A0A074LDG0_9BACT|nr:glycosyltransferase [Anditalea andensis]KEO71827.1 hypothetical protein EL17_21135 [Anditalea andensis]